MSGDWYNNVNQQPYSQPFYPHQQPHGHYPQPQPQPQPPQIIYHQQPQPGQPIDHQYIPYPPDHQEFHFSQQPQVQPQPMPTRASTRSVTLDPAYQHPQDVYGHAPSDVTGRLRTRSAVNYGGHPVPNNPPPTNDQRLRNRAARVNYKDEDDEFVPDDGAPAYGIAATRPRRGNHQPQQSYEDYRATGTDDDDVYQPDQPAEVQPDQQPSTRYHASTTVNNGTINPAVITTKEEENEIAVTKRGRVVRKKTLIESSDEEEAHSTSRRVSRKGNEEFIAPDNEDDEEEDMGDDSFGQPRLARLTRGKAAQLSNQRTSETKSRSRKEEKKRKKSSRKHAKEGSEDDYVDEDDEDDSLDEEDLDLHQTSPSLPPTDDEQDDGDASGPKTYGFRSRQGQPTTYNEIAAFEKMEQNGAAVRKKSKSKKTKMNWTGKDYENAWGPLPGQSDSDSDHGLTPKKPGMGIPGLPADGAMLAGGAGLPLDIAGTPSNLGRVGEAGTFHECVHDAHSLPDLVDRSG